MMIPAPELALKRVLFSTIFRFPSIHTRSGNPPLPIGPATVLLTKIESDVVKLKPRKTPKNPFLNSLFLSVKLLENVSE
jgi:hypothetical protein